MLQQNFNSLNIIASLKWATGRATSTFTVHCRRCFLILFYESMMTNESFSRIAPFFTFFPFISLINSCFSFPSFFRWFPLDFPHIPFSWKAVNFFFLSFLTPSYLSLSSSSSILLLFSDLIPNVFMCQSVNRCCCRCCCYCIMTAFALRIQLVYFRIFRLCICSMFMQTTNGNIVTDLKTLNIMWNCRYVHRMHSIVFKFSSLKSLVFGARLWIEMLFIIIEPWQIVH